MITEIGISNFRSIKEQNIPLKKFNILYGPNGSGKSSVMYAPIVMKNLFVNPNQKLNSLFNLGFIDMGGFENASNSKDDSDPISIYITSDIIQRNNKQNSITYYLHLYSFLSSVIEYKINDYHDVINFDLPATNVQRQEVTLLDSKFLWNGFAFELFKPHSNNINTPYTVINLNTIYNDIISTEIISVKRGFFSPIFSSEANTNESRLAMQIRNEGLDFELKIDKYFNSIFDKNFRFVAVPGSSSFYLRTHDKKGVTIDLVNEGFGINQTVYMLIKILKKETTLAFIEEPEIHLHPSAQGKLVDAFFEIIKKENKQIFLSTHSENIVTATLSKISAGEISIDDVQFLLAQNENGETKIIPQTVNENGQIEGGLLSFMETELESLKKFLGI